MKPTRQNLRPKAVDLIREETVFGFFGEKLAISMRSLG